MAAGLCAKCGRAEAVPERTTCERCAVKHRDRDRHERAKEQGIPYGGRDPEARRRAGRESSRRRTETRKAAGVCIRCARNPPEAGRSMCEPCRNDKREAKRARHHERRAAGLCVKCSEPAPDGKTYCRPCAVAKEKRRNREAEYAARRARYADRRARGRCVQCEAPSPGVARCEPCSRKHREGSGAFRGIPVWDPSWTVIEIATGREHGPYDSEADVALCLAFEKLTRHEVEIVADISPTATMTAPPW